MNKQKAPGPDGLTAEIFRQISSHPLVFIINRCVIQGTWPSILKELVVMFIFK